MNTETLDLSQSHYSAVFLSENLSFNDAVNRYKNRRDRLLDKLSSICIIQGVSIPLSQHNPWLNRSRNLYQEPNFLYLTGLNQDNSALIVNPLTKQSILCLPKLDQTHIFWEGYNIGVDPENETHNKALCEQLLVDEVALFNDRYDILIQLLNTHKQNMLSTFFFEAPDANKQMPDSSFLSKCELEETLKDEELSIHIQNIEPLLTARVELDVHDQHLMRKANDNTANAFRSICKTFKEFNTEGDIAGFIKNQAYKASFLGESFAPIVAQGANAGILHYNKNNDSLEKGNLLLLDFGCREQSIPADISRTIPISGQFNPLQKCLYNIVLEAQEKVQALAKAGQSFSVLNDACWSHIEEQLDKQLRSKGAKIQRSYDERPHNVSHLIGHMVHDGDPYRRYYQAPLKPGIVISNEPGLYGYFEMSIDGVLYKEHCGIRIEDNLLITENGCENLSQNCPKSIDDIERLLQ